MIGCRENYWNPKWCPLYSLSVCVSVFARATDYTFWPWNQIFGMSDIWHMRKNIFFPRNFLFRLFYWHWWRFWKPLITMFLMISRFLPDNKRFCYLPLFLMSDVRLLSCILSNENAKIQKVIQSGGTYANIKD